MTGEETVPTGRHEGMEHNEKITKQERERSRQLAQRVAGELAPRTVALLGEAPALESALRAANLTPAAGPEADLLMVSDPAWVELPERLPGAVLLVCAASEELSSWAEELLARGYSRDFSWKNRGRTQQTALFRLAGPKRETLAVDYEAELDTLRVRMARAMRTRRVSSSAS